MSRTTCTRWSQNARWPSTALTVHPAGISVRRSSSVAASTNMRIRSSDLRFASMKDRSTGISLEGEGVGTLVATGALLGDLHQHVVQQARRADPEPVRGHPG